MPSTRPDHRMVRLLALLLGGLSVAGPVCGDELEWDAEIGYVARGKPVIKPDYWYPVYVTIAAGEREVAGRVTLSQDRGAAEVILPVQVARGTRKTFHTYFRPLETNSLLNVDLRVRGYGQEVRSVRFDVAEPADQHVLALMAETGGLAFLNRRADRDEQDPRPAPPAARRVMYGSPERLPADSLALEALDAIMIDGPTARRLSGDQWAAIDDWNARGGRLLVAGGADRDFFAGSDGFERFGIRFGAPEPIDRWADGDPVRLLMSPIDAGRPWDRVWIAESGRPLLAGVRRGRGWVTAGAVAWDATLFERIQARVDGEAIWAACVERRWAHSPVSALDRTFGPVLSMGLQLPFTFELVGAWGVFVFLGLYVLVCLPATWVIMSRLKRRVLAWPVAVVLALGFAGYGYLRGSLSQQTDFVVNEITLLDRALPDGPVRATTYSSIFAPRRFAGDPVLPGLAFIRDAPPGVPGHMGFVGPGPEASGGPLRLLFGAREVAADFSILPWSARNLATTFRVPIEGRVRVETGRTSRDHAAAPDPTSLPPVDIARVVNDTRLTFQRFWLRHGDSVHEVDRTLAPGESLDWPVAGSTRLRRDWSHLARPVLNGMERVMHFGQVKGETQWRYSSWSGTMQQAELRDLAVQPLFVGETEQAYSPLTQALGLPRPNGLTFYAQPLDVELEAAAPRSADWRFEFDDDTMFRHLERNWGQRAPVDAGPEVAIYLSRIEARIVPDRPVTAPPGARLELTLRLGAWPTHESRYSPPGRSEAWEMVGCPFELYDFRAERWIAFERTLGERLTFEDAARFLEPGTRALRLRLIAEPEHVIYRRPVPGGGFAYANGDELFGDQQPFDYVNRPYAAGPNAPDGPVQGRVTGLSVRILPPAARPADDDPPSEEARR